MKRSHEHSADHGLFVDDSTLLIGSIGPRANVGTPHRRSRCCSSSIQEFTVGTRRCPFWVQFSTDSGRGCEEMGPNDLMVGREQPLIREKGPWHTAAFVAAEIPHYLHAVAAGAGREMRSVRHQPAKVAGVRSSPRVVKKWSR